MTERYDDRASAHYAAYRPPLHKMILERVLGDRERFDVGLDVGCGTGYSARVLADYCGRVYGIDPSPSMLKRATTDPRVHYLCAAASDVPLANASVNIVTFGGSLFYADSRAARAELNRVCESGIVVVYDFEVLLDEVLRECGIDAKTAASDYNHRANLSGANGFTELALARERVTLAVNANELAHVLLSDSNRLDRFAWKYREPDPFVALTGELGSRRHLPTLAVDIYYSKYRVR